MRLEEADLMLPVDAWWVGGRPHDAEVVPHLSRVDRHRRLRDQLCPPHILPVPVGRAIERELGALLAS